MLREYFIKIVHQAGNSYKLRVKAESASGALTKAEEQGNLLNCTITIESLPEGQHE